MIPQQGDIVVTRHPALVEVLKDLGVVAEDVEVIAHATPEDVRGKVVAGVLPLHLAAEARAVIAIELRVPPELRGKELTAEQVREYLVSISWYEVRRTYRLTYNQPLGGGQE